MGADRLHVAGYCPMGCGQTLYVDIEQEPTQVLCVEGDCPRNDAMSLIMGNPETEHVVDFQADGYTVQHPLRERILGHLFDCPLFEQLSSIPNMRWQGKFRVTTGDPERGFGSAGIHFEKVDG